MVHQAFKLFESLTVWENVVFGAEPRRGPFIDRAEARRRVARLCERHGLAAPLDAAIRDLSVGVRQRVEILKLLYRDARLLILDEPTAVLTPQESDALFGVMRRLASEGRTLLFVTHKLREVMAVTDAVTVLRDGRVAGRMRTAETSEREIVRAMTGRSVTAQTAGAAPPLGAPRLEAEELTVIGEGGKPRVDRVSFTVRSGEIVGVAGVAGNGQSELVEALAGLRAADGGAVRIGGRDVAALGVAARRAAGLAYIPEDRAAVGAATAASVADNLVMGFHHAPPIARHGLIDAAAKTAFAAKLIAAFGVKTAGPEAPAGALSGGNLQKLVVARELSHEAPALIAEQPTRGVDIGATEFIHGRLLEERARGRAVLLVSSELSEILALSDRILVMYEGRILAETARADATEERIGALMAGRLEAAA
jgi:simple sugar transport system ATP-binding protein